MKGNCDAINLKIADFPKVAYIRTCMKQGENGSKSHRMQSGVFVPEAEGKDISCTRMSQNEPRVTGARGFVVLSKGTKLKASYKMRKSY